MLMHNYFPYLNYPFTKVANDKRFRLITSNQSIHARILAILRRIVFQLVDAGPSHTLVSADSGGKGAVTPELLNPIRQPYLRLMDNRLCLFHAIPELINYFG